MDTDASASSREGLTGNGPAPNGDQAFWRDFAQPKSPEAFCQSWLAAQCHMISEVSGGVVLLAPPESGPFTPVAVWPDGRQATQDLAAAAQRALIERRSLVLRPVPEGATGIPTPDRFLVAHPILVDGRVHSIVVLDIAPRPEPKLRGVLGQLQRGAVWLELLFRREDASKDAAARARLQTVLDLVATTLEPDRFSGAAMALVTALATKLGCDRVSVGFVKGKRVQVRAVSHSAQFGKQTNLIRAIESVMDEAFDQQASIVYPAAPDADARVTRAHADLARQHGSGTICSIPLGSHGRLVGVLTLERPADQPFDSRTVELCEAVAAVAGPMLEVKRRDDRWLLAKATESAGRELGRLIGPRYIGRKLALMGLAAIIAFFAYFEADYRVTARTSIEAAVQRAAAAPFDGFIARASVRAGDVVRAGQMLAALDDRDLQLERLKWTSQHDQLLKQYRQALAAGEAAQVRIFTAQIDQASAQLALLSTQISRTQVRSPFDGLVVTGDLSQSLGAPIQRGEVLFEIAPLDAYRIVLQVDERDVADVAIGRRGHLVLSAFPTDPLPFTVEKLTPVSTAREGRNYFRVEARLASTPGRLRPGMEGIGKIEVDRRLLIWIWTRQAVDWLRLKLWAWSP